MCPVFSGLIPTSMKSASSKVCLELLAGNLFDEVFIGNASWGYVLQVRTRNTSWKCFSKVLAVKSDKSILGSGLEIHKISQIPSQSDDPLSGVKSKIKGLYGRSSGAMLLLSIAN